MSRPPTPGPYRVQRPYYGSGYAGLGFRGIGGHLLQTFPRLPAVPAPPPPPEAPAGGVAAHGSYLLAPMLSGPGGFRIAPCPVCATQATIPRTAGGWAHIRCDSCGTEFFATDGTAPPPTLAPPAPPPVPAPTTTLEILRRNLRRWIEAGEPDRWVAARKGAWNEADLGRLIDALAGSAFWPLDIGGLRQALAEAAGRYRASAASPEVGLRIVNTSEVRTAEDGSRWVRCPYCRAFDVTLPIRILRVLSLTCPGCHRPFGVAPPSGPKPPLLPPLSPKPTPFETVYRWFRYFVLIVGVLLSACCVAPTFFLLLRKIFGFD